VSAALVQRSTVGGVEQTAQPPWTETEVPSYVVLVGSVQEAATSLGLRLLGRRETSDAVCAELHERGVAGSHWAVRP